VAAGLEAGPDGRRRCRWGLSAPDFLAYHDKEWGRPVLDEDGLFERLCLEAFQSGLSWLTILRKREAFRDAFASFDITAVARFGDRDVERLLADERIVRNRRKIVAAIENAKAAVRLGDSPSFAELVWSHRPARRRAPATLSDVAATTAESKALALELKRHGFRFVGPTTAYALMQACGVVNDHVRGCYVRAEVERERTRAIRALEADTKNRKSTGRFPKSRQG
jgi:DNA-3-methyladenine glycosylase I